MLLDLEFIIKIAKEKIEKMKALQEDELIDPAYSWFQNDPENKKANALMDIYKIVASQISSQTTSEHQKIIIRKNLYHYNWRAIQLMFILSFPEEPFGFLYTDKNYSKMMKEDISNETMEKYYKWCTLHNPTTKNLGFSLDKSFVNSAIIAEKYSLPTLISALLFEPLINIGDRGAWDQMYELKKYFLKEIITFMKKLNNDGTCDPGSFSILEKIEKALNSKMEKDFCEGK